jgi:RibD domain-containing protein
MKATARTDLTVGGAELAALAFRAELIDECHLFLNPIVVGSGKQALPSKLRTRLDLLDEGHFGNGVVHLHAPGARSESVVQGWVRRVRRGRSVGGCVAVSARPAVVAPLSRLGVSLHFAAPTEFGPATPTLTRW